MFLTTALSASLLFTGAVLSAPSPQLLPRATPISEQEVDTFSPFTQFARASYCNVDKLRSWSCGQACAAIPGFQPTLVGRTLSTTYLVGYWPQQNSVVVARQGTDPLNLFSVLTDANVIQTQLDPAHFPGVSSSVFVHDGFKDEHAATASTIRAEVKRLMSLKGTSNISLSGHSLGGAVTALEALSLKLHIPTANIKAITYGTPRIGNAAWAQFFDSKVTNYRRVNNDHDVIPIVPGRSLGYSHTKGETHMLDGNVVVACAGNDDATDAQCQIKTVPDIFSGNILDHLGPYDGIYLGTIFCN